MRTLIMYASPLLPPIQPPILARAVVKVGEGGGTMAEQAEGDAVRAGLSEAEPRDADGRAAGEHPGHARLDHVRARAPDGPAVPHARGQAREPVRCGCSPTTSASGEQGAWGRWRPSSTTAPPTWWCCRRRP